MRRLIAVRNAIRGTRPATSPVSMRPAMSSVRSRRRDEAKAARLDRWLRWAYPLAYVLVAGSVIAAAL